MKGTGQGRMAKGSGTMWDVDRENLGRNTKREQQLGVAESELKHGILLAFVQIFICVNLCYDQFVLCVNKMSTWLYLGIIPKR